LVTFGEPFGQNVLRQSGEKAQVSVVPFGERPGRIGKDGQSPGDSPAGEKGDGERGTQRLGRGLQSSSQVEAGGWIFFEGAGGLEFRPQRGVDVGVVKFGASGGAANQIVLCEKPDYRSITAGDVQSQSGYSLQCSGQGQGSGVDGAQGFDQVFEKGRGLAVLPISCVLQRLENRDCGYELFEGLPIEGESLVHDGPPCDLLSAKLQTAQVVGSGD